MARRIKVAVGILNVRLHPHSTERYASFIKDIYRQKQIVRIYGDRHGMLSSIDHNEQENGVVSGAITTFTHISKDGPWFDASDLKEATDEKVSTINIPNNLYPNAASFYFQLNTNNHRLYVQLYSKGRSLTPASALSLFNNLSSNLNILKKYGEAKISIVQDKQALEKLFSLKTIREIVITIQKPNSDVFSDNFEADIEKHLAETNSKQISITYEAEAGGSIKPNAEILQVSNAALENGRVQVKGRDETGAVHKSTDNFPKILQGVYDPEQTGERDAFRRVVSQDQVETLSNLDQIKTFSNRIARYFRAYGGMRAVITSPYFITSAIISLVNYDNWIEPRWIPVCQSLIPNLLGFSLGTYAILFSLITSRLKRAMKLLRNESGVTYLEEVNATFFHFIFVQVITLCWSFIFFGTALRDLVLYLDISWLNILFYILFLFGSFLGFLLLVYSILLILGAALAVYRLAMIVDPKE